VALGRSRLEPGPAAALALDLFVTLLEEAFAFAIFAFLFLFSGVLLHVCPLIQDRCLLPRQWFGCHQFLVKRSALKRSIESDDRIRRYAHGTLSKDSCSTIGARVPPYRSTCDWMRLSRESTTAIC
jgi:hypothetical protein